MKFVPQKIGLDMDFLYDGVDKELIGQKIMISDLEKLFPGEEIVLMKDKGFLVFGIENPGKKIYRYLAHECIHCNELIMGPPEKKYFNTFTRTEFDKASTPLVVIGPLSGSAGNDYSCKNCGSHLETIYDAIS